MHRLGFLERPEMSCVCAQFPQPAGNDMFGTKAAFRDHGWGRARGSGRCEEHVGRPHLQGLKHGAAAKRY